MRSIVQRVLSAGVKNQDLSSGCVVAEHSIDRGILVYACVHSTDTDNELQWMAHKIFNMRIFPNIDEEKNFDISVLDLQYEVLIISNFTLYAQVNRGNRPSLSFGISVEEAADKFNRFIAICESVVHAQGHTKTILKYGWFGARMQVSSVLDGPVNLIIDSP